MNPLKASALVPRSPLDLGDALRQDTDRPIEVELGCGDGLFLVRRAQQHPDREFVGLDIRPEFLSRGRAVSATLGLRNLRLELCNLLVDTKSLFGRYQVSTFYINFPDPLFKARQRLRRWLSTEVVQNLVSVLKPRGRIIFQSDVWEPSIDAMGLLELHPKLWNVAGEFSFVRKALVEEKTSREIACERLGRRIWRMCYERMETPDL